MKNLIILFITILLLFALIGCNSIKEPSIADFDVNNASHNILPDEDNKSTNQTPKSLDLVSGEYGAPWKESYKYDIPILIDSLSDWIEFLKDHPIDRIKDNISLENYNDEFFKERLIYAYVKSEGSGSNNLRVNRAELNGDKLNLFMTRTVPVVGTCDMATLVCLFGINRDDIKDVKAVEGIILHLEHEFIVNGILDKEAAINSYRENKVDTVQSMAQLYIDAIKIGVDLANDEDAIEMFDLLFDRQTLSFDNIGSEENQMPDGYRCDIIGSGPKGDQIVPLFIIFQENDLRFFSPLSRYGKQSREAVKSYLNYLMEGEAAELARWLSIDGDGSDYLDEANHLIEHYSQFNLSKAEIVSFGYNNDIDKFAYLIQDGQGETFEILMNYGDGFSMPDIYSVLDGLTDVNN